MTGEEDRAAEAGGRSLLSGLTDIAGVGLRITAGAARAAGDGAARMLPALGTGAQAVGRAAESVAHTAGDAAAAVGRTAEAKTVEGLRPVINLVLRALTAEVDLTTFVQDNVDINELARGVDVNAIAAQVDVNAIAGQVDVDAIAARMDLDAIVDSVDLNRQVARVDIGAVVERVDVNAIAAEVDVDAIAAKVDVNAIAEKIDIDAIIERMDLVELARVIIDGVDLPHIIRQSTGSLSTEAVRGVRTQAMNADDAVSVMVGRLLRRHSPRRENLHATRQHG